MAMPRNEHDPISANKYSNSVVGLINSRIQDHEISNSSVNLSGIISLDISSKSDVSHSLPMPIVIHTEIISTKDERIKNSENNFVGSTIINDEDKYSHRPVIIRNVRNTSLFPNSSNAQSHFKNDLNIARSKLTHHFDTRPAMKITDSNISDINHRNYCSNLKNENCVNPEKIIEMTSVKNVKRPETPEYTRKMFPLMDTTVESSSNSNGIICSGENDTDLHIEFDGTTVLCRVCGDKASGFHYGVHSCEGCKGFFRRSIQQKIQYRPCTKNQQCNILRINRNRCQYCRLKKCIAVGMSRDAVRFGRVPKREKARILAAMQQSTHNRGQQQALASELDDQPRLLASVLRAHMATCEFTHEKVTSMRERARECPQFSLPTLACPLNPAPELQSEQEFSQRFAHVIRGVIDFAGMIPGFQLLTQDDKFTLLKAGLFDALFVRLICMFDSSINSIICLNGQVMRRDAIQNGANARFLVDSTFNFSERINSMNLTDAEIGLFSAIVLITPDRPGLRDLELVEKMYSRLKGCLQSVITQNRPNDTEFLSELMKLLPDLRTLSTLHTEKLVVFRTEHKELLRQQMWSLEDESSKSTTGSVSWGSCNDQIMEEVTKSPANSVSSTESNQNILEYSQSLSASSPLLAATLSGGCPLRMRAHSGSSAEDDVVGTAHLTQNGLTITPIVRVSVPTTNHQNNFSSTSNHLHHQIRYRKLDSPTDSGIESGNEKIEHKATCSESSSCSSPRSSVDDITEDKRQGIDDMPVLKRVLQAPPLYDTNSLMDEAYKPHKKFRALRHREFDTEAEPARYQPTQQYQQFSNHPSHHTATNCMPHKVKPNLPKLSPTTLSPMATTTSVQHHEAHLTQHTTSLLQTNNQLIQNSQLHMHLTRPQQNQNQSSLELQKYPQLQQQQSSLLSSTHSVLARSLMEEPHMTPEQIKRSDIIQNYIKRESQADLQNTVTYTTPVQGNTTNETCSTALASCVNQRYTLTNNWFENGNRSKNNVSPVSASSTNISTTVGVITTTRQHAIPSQNNRNEITSGSCEHITNSAMDSSIYSDYSQSHHQSPHSTSTSPSRINQSSSPSSRIMELHVDIADSQQPLNLSKKSPTLSRIDINSSSKSGNELMINDSPAASSDVTVTTVRNIKLEA